MDNSDGALNTKTYEGQTLTLNYAFSGLTGSNLAPLTVLTQQHTSEEGQLLLRLNCIDNWGLLSEVNATVGNQFWNFPEQAPDEAADDPEHYGKTILHIITALIWEAVGKVVEFSPANDDGIINVQTPAVSISNARAGVKALLSMTKCFLLWKNNKYVVIKPDAHPTVYNYNQADLFFGNVVGAGITIPNRVIFYGFDKSIFPFWTPSTAYALGNKVVPRALTGWREYRRYNCTTAGMSGPIEPVWSKAVGSVVSESPPGTAMWTCETRVLSGIAEDTGSSDLIGQIGIHFRGTRDELHSSSDLIHLTALAQGKLSKIQASRDQGLLIAPMHCAQELFDKIGIVDTRYSPARTVLGYVHQIVREYNRGVYQITLVLGGVSTGFTPTGGYPVPTEAAEVDAGQTFAERITGGRIAGGIGNVILNEHGLGLWGEQLNFWDVDGNHRATIFGTLAATWFMSKVDILLFTPPGNSIWCFEKLRPTTDDAFDIGVLTHRWREGHINKVFAPTRLRIPVGVDMFG